MDDEHVGDFFPRLEFVPYGLDSSWTEPRWLEFVDGELGRPAVTLWLTHGTGRDPEPGTPWALVGTVSLDRLAAAKAHGTDTEQVAVSAMWALVNRTQPNGPRQPRRFYKRRNNFVLESAQNYGSWRQVSWHIDGRTAAARVFDWAGAWAGFTTDTPGVAVIVVAQDLQADGFTLTKLVDCAAYHFDLDAPIHWPGTPQSSVLIGLGNLAAVQALPRPLHDDQKRLLDGR